ncbi:hypothetical protein HaLaN_15132, partial [Haematococcus lacustris]
MGAALGMVLQEVEQLLAALPLANRVSAALIIQTCYRIASQFDKTGASLVAGIQALRANVGAHPAATTPSGPADPSGTSPTIPHPPHQAQAQTPLPAMGLPVSTALGGGA